MTRLLLFARARELAGTRSVEVAPGTVAEVLDDARRRFGPEFDRLCETCTVVVDDEVVHRSEFGQRASGGELAILPPVSGGSGGSHRGDGHGDDPVPAPSVLRASVLTVSDRASAGEYEDLTGPAVESVLVEQLGAVVVERELVADDVDSIQSVLRRWCDEAGVDLVVTNGGTGLSPRDVTPEAVRSLLDVEAPGLGELMRSAGLAHTPFAALSRQVAGRRGATIVLTVPGSVKGAVESLEAVVGVLAHAVSTAGGGAPARGGQP